MKAPPEFLRTKRLLLRRWKPEDLPAFVGLSADPHVMRFFDAPRTPQQTEVSVRRFSEYFDSRGTSLWAVEVPGVAPFIGCLGCFPARETMPYGPAFELGWRLDASSWGHGYATEGMWCALHDVMDRLAPPEVVAVTVPINMPSRRVMEKLGMTHDAADDFDHPEVPPGNPKRRHVLYRLSQQRYREMSS
jgi:RimJ/RimL family protein N-acetyltransferase